MKIALYYPWIALKSGIERTILEIIKNSTHEYTVYTHHLNLNNTFPEFKNVKIVLLRPIPLKSDLISTIISATIIAIQKIDLSGFDLLLLNTEGIADLILFRNHKIQTASICYTPFRPVYDNIHKTKLDSKTNLLGKLLFKILAGIFMFTDKKLWKKINHIFFISKESLRRARNGGLVSNINHYSFFNPGVNSYSIKKTTKYLDYFFLPGRITWSKNIELAILAFNSFKEKYSATNFRLVIAGQVDKKSFGYFRHLRSLSKANNSITFIKNPSDKIMNDLYSNCYATIATAFNEDWGLTPIEGNAHGKASLFMSSGGYNESQIDNKTGISFKDDVDDLASKMLILVKRRKYAIKLGEQGRINSNKYSWSRAVKILDSKLFKIVNS